MSDRINKSLIPTGHDGWPIFADDWHERTERRDAVYAEAELEPWEESLSNQLAGRISVSFEEQPIGEALQFLANQSWF